MEDGSIVLNNVVYYQPPALIEDMYDTHGVRAESRKLLRGRRVVSVESSQDVDTYTQYRKLHKQAWRFTWTAEDAPAESNLYQHLWRLYNSDLPVWVEQDAEMSRTLARLRSPFINPQNAVDPKPYFTPTYPIFPASWSNGDDVDWSAESVTINGVEYPGIITVDSETGLVLINNNFETTAITKVEFSYKWRAYAYIAEFNLVPVDQLAQNHYAGSIVFEQLDFPEAV